MKVFILFVCLFVCLFSHSADPGVLMVPPVAVLPPPVSPVRTTAGKALFENLYIPPLPPGVKPLNSFASLQASPPSEMQAGVKFADTKYVRYFLLKKSLRKALVFLTTLND